MAKVPNGYPKPLGYNYKNFTGVQAVAPYFAWNGAINCYSPGRTLVGAAQGLSVASVPADLSTLILTAPNGQQLLFQFVYNASVQTAGIKVPLPASGASTAAQVATALLAVLAQASGVDINGVLKYFPWQAASGGATLVLVNYVVPGVANAISGTQATITVAGTSPPTFVGGQSLPARLGMGSAMLPGS